VDVVANRQAVLFCGAGISMSAGLPSAAVFAEHLAKVLHENDPEYPVSPAGAAFAAIASDIEACYSREFLLHEVAKLLDSPLGLRPTVAHIKAVELFDQILTTNWDALFEKAARFQGRPTIVLADEIPAGLPERAIVKLHGSLEHPESLLLTEADMAGMDKSRAGLWEAVRNAVRDHTLVIVGTSLRDPSIIRLLEDARRQYNGYFVAPKFYATTAARLRRWNFECIAADADSFLARLADAVGKRNLS
jgi:NAD-dependent SIR2 family protein deacetylase